MGKGKTPFCDMEKMKRGVWSPEEDAKLIQYIKEHGHGTWRHLSKQAGFLFLLLFFLCLFFKKNLVLKFLSSH